MPPDAPTTPHRGRISVSPDGAFVVVVDGATASLARASSVREELGRAVAFDRDVVAVAWTRVGRVAAFALEDGDVCVMRATERDGLTSERWFRGVGAGRWGAGPLGDSQLRFERDGSEGNTTVIDVSTGEVAILTHARKGRDGSALETFATSVDGRWMVFLTRDEDARERVEVFSTRAPYEGAITFRLPASMDARAVAFSSGGEELLVFDDSCEATAEPGLEVFAADGTPRASIRGVTAPYVRMRDGIVCATSASRDAIVWIDEVTWRIARVVTHPTTCEATTSTRVYRQIDDGYEERNTYTQKTVSCDEFGVERVGVRISLSPCETMLASTCAGHDDKVLFLWSARALEHDDAPLAIFLHSKAIVDFKWCRDDRVDGAARLQFVCAGDAAVYSFVPGMSCPVRSALECAEFAPSKIVHASAEPDALIIKGKGKTFVQQRFPMSVM